MIAIFVSSLREPPGLFKELSENTCAGPLNLVNSLVGLPRILLYCYKPVSVASMYAHAVSPDPLRYENQGISCLVFTLGAEDLKNTLELKLAWRADCRRGHNSP